MARKLRELFKRRYYYETGDQWPNDLDTAKLIIKHKFEKTTTFEKKTRRSIMKGDLSKMDLRVLCELLKKAKFNLSNELQERMSKENVEIETIYKIFDKCCHQYTMGVLPSDEKLKQDLTDVVRFWKSQIKCDHTQLVSSSVLFLYDGNAELAFKTENLFDELRNYLLQQKMIKDVVPRWTCRMCFDELFAEKNDRKRHVIEEKLTMFQITRGLKEDSGFYGDHYNYVNMIRSTAPFTTTCFRNLFEKRYKKKTGKEWPKDKRQAAEEFKKLFKDGKLNQKWNDKDVRERLRSGDLLNMDLHVLSKVLFHSNFICEDDSEDEIEKIKKENEDIRRLTRIRNKSVHDYTFDTPLNQDELLEELSFTVKFWKDSISEAEIEKYKKEMSGRNEEDDPIARLYGDRRAAVKTRILYNKLHNFFKEYRISSRISSSWALRMCFDEFFDQEKISTSKEEIEEHIIQFQSWYYQMKSKPIGFCIIINNIKFNQSEKRKGSHRDAQRLDKIFSGFGFTVEIENNLTAEAMRQCLKGVLNRNEELEKHDAIVFIVLSHGEPGVVLGTDEEKVEVFEFLNMFDSNICSELCGKPKILIFQCCRGGNYLMALSKFLIKNVSGDASYKFLKNIDQKRNLRHSISHDGKSVASCESLSRSTSELSDGCDFESTSAIEKGASEENKYLETGIYSDIFICYATPLGLMAHRDSEKGAFYIRALCDALELEKNVYNKDFVSILHSVTEYLKSQKNTIYAHIPDYTLIGVDKLLYLHRSPIAKDCVRRKSE
ncbi:caspase-8-like protein [Dinothrombium tinctorium]|uniref:Caspase-8-like protein n=1 Tax=Dinothrombium tinctorium TaxID=1965070 RepID=A0A3S4R2F6_9ACAR|nr:caspase-8-like protein [Dinothrombium tinctorium]RWS10526.1 caspase-8-like protein [Dinothrombium tinctorium]RWS10681.1 caspase-8-like protein [Dinothrombium tinctorium]RWS10714.1 caspase-8-like protein [Dinothrombium tinctorium]